MEDGAEGIDPVALEVVWSKLRQIPRRMGVQMSKTAYSDVIRFGEDFATAVFTPAGRLLAQGTDTPGHLGSLPSTLGLILEDHIPAEEFEDGDVVMTNHPYIGAGHLPDVFMFSPVFFEGDLVGFIGTTAHHLDFGGPYPGSHAVTARDMYGEGLLIPPVHLYKGGALNEAVLDIVLQNSRSSRTVEGDIRAQLSATEVGVERLRAVVDEYGAETLRTYAEEILERTEASFRDAIDDLPDGRYGFEDKLDAFEETGRITFAVTVHIDGDELTVDFTGTDDEVYGYSINSVWNYTYAYTLLAVKSVVDPETPQTHGSIAPVELQVPERSILNPSPPAPVALRNVAMGRIVSTVNGALHEVAPKRVPASSGEFSLQIFEFDGAGSRDERSETKLHHDTFFGGGGGWSHRDGYPGKSGSTNVKNHPIETTELEFPMRIIRYEMVPDTGGPGEYRGGPATVREYEFLTDTWLQMCNNERFIVPPYGLAGGRSGETGQVVLNPDGECRELHPKENLEVEVGDVVRIQHHGGGGYGRPEDRDLEAIEADIENGIVTPERAALVYGLTADDRD